MARRLAPKDCYALMNALVEEATGQKSAIQAVDTSSFVSCGETVLSTGTENVLNSLAMVVGRRHMAVRPYNAPLNLINVIDTGLYTDRLLKDSFYSRAAQPSGAFNTDLSQTLTPDSLQAKTLADHLLQHSLQNHSGNRIFLLPWNLISQEETPGRTAAPFRRFSFSRHSDQKQIFLNSFPVI